MLWDDLSLLSRFFLINGEFTNSEGFLGNRECETLGLCVFLGMGEWASLGLEVSFVIFSFSFVLLDRLVVTGECSVLSLSLATLLFSSCLFLFSPVMSDSFDGFLDRSFSPPDLSVVLGLSDLRAFVSSLDNSSDFQVSSLVFIPYKEPH